MTRAWNTSSWGCFWSCHDGFCMYVPHHQLAQSQGIHKWATFMCQKCVSIYSARCVNMCNYFVQETMHLLIYHWLHTLLLLSQQHNMMRKYLVISIVWQGMHDFWRLEIKEPPVVSICNQMHCIPISRSFTICNPADQTAGFSFFNLRHHCHRCLAILRSRQHS
jgi:hypothetical protein